jgi:hypothetical protein
MRKAQVKREKQKGTARRVGDGKMPAKWKDKQSHLQPPVANLRGRRAPAV